MMTAGTKAITSLLYITPDAEQHDRAELRKLCQRIVGNIPTMQTDIGREELECILTPVNNLLSTLMLEAAERDLTQQPITQQSVQCKPERNKATWCRR